MPRIIEILINLPKDEETKFYLFILFFQGTQLWKRFWRPTICDCQSIQLSDRNLPRVFEYSIKIVLQRYHHSIPSAVKVGWYLFVYYTPANRFHRSVGQGLFTLLCPITKPYPATAAAIAAHSYPYYLLGDELAACAYISDAKWPIFKVIFRVEAKAFSHWIISQWIDLFMEKRMPFRTSRNSS